MKWLRKEAARVCPVHMAVVSQATTHLVDFGYFSKSIVIQGAGMMAVEDSIRWDYIREFIQEDQDVELIPLAQAFFTRHKKADEYINPATYLAQGFGKKTAGFAAVIGQNDHLVIRRIEQRKALSNGVAESFQRFIDKVEARHALERAMLPHQPDSPDNPVITQEQP